MALVVPNTADLLMLRYIVNNLQQDSTTAGLSSGQRVIKLYTNNLSPSKTTTAAQVTEASDPNYSGITLLGASWTFATDTAGTNKATYSAQTFTFSGATTCYGYFVTDLTSNLLWIERFSTGPFSLPPGGGEITVTPVLTAN